MAGWWDTLFGTGPKTFEQDLELLVARWQDAGRERGPMAAMDIAARLRTKAGQLEKPTSQGA